MIDEVPQQSWRTILRTIVNQNQLKFLSERAKCIQQVINQLGETPLFIVKRYNN